jgi:hypothetical protein
MDNEISIPIPPNLEDDEGEVDLIEYLESYADDLSPAFDLKVDDADCRTSYVDHQITHASLTDSGVWIEYEILTHTYHGCKDMNSDGRVWRDLFGVRSGTHWVFKPSLSLDPRSTFEEF